MKNEIRKIYKTKRADMSSCEVKQKSKIATQAFILSNIYINAEKIMLYMPINNEIDTSFIMDMAFIDGKNVILPVTNKESGEITPHYVSKDTVYKKGAFSIFEPDTDDIAEISEIDVIIVPGIAFDNKGNRIGFGKGCYDGLLKNCSAIKVGYCYGYQVINEVPSLPHDIKMDYLLTENGLIKI